MKEIKIMDTTLRDAHQCLWATRMTTAMMIPVAERMDRIGFYALDFMGQSQFDVCVRYLKEDPWERMRLIRELVTETPIQATVRSKTLIGFKPVPDDLMELWVHRLLANGARRVRGFDPLGDLDTIVDSLSLAKRLGAHTVGGLAFTESPVHTDAFYVAKAKELVARADVDSIMLKDASGLLTPDRVRTLVPALRQAIGSVRLEVHTHCMTGLGPLVYLESARLGADQVDTSIAPLANGAAQPATQTIVRNLRAMGFTVNLDDTLIDEVSQHFRLVAEQEGLPVGVPAEYDAFHYQHQLPGGMISNFHFQLAQVSMSDKFDAVLEECARVRSELGWPIMITPFAQIVGVQAVLNVVHGERYKVVADEIKKYAFGHYGKLVAPVEPDVLDRIAHNGSPDIATTPEPLSPALPGLRKRYPKADDDELLLRYAFAGSQVDEMIAAGPTKTEYTFEKPLVRLIRELAQRPKLGCVHIQKGDMLLELNMARGKGAHAVV